MDIVKDILMNINPKYPAPEAFDSTDAVWHDPGHIQ